MLIDITETSPARVTAVDARCGGSDGVCIESGDSVSVDWLV